MRPSSRSTSPAIARCSLSFASCNLLFKVHSLALDRRFSFSAKSCRKFTGRMNACIDLLHHVEVRLRATSPLHHVRLRAREHRHQGVPGELVDKSPELLEAGRGAKLIEPRSGHDLGRRRCGDHLGGAPEVAPTSCAIDEGRIPCGLPLAGALLPAPALAGNCGGLLFMYSIWSC